MTLSPFFTFVFYTAFACAGAAPGSGATELVLAIVDATVFDPEAEQLLPHRTIVIRGQRIVSVNPSAPPSQIPPEAVRIDGRGKYVLPGLIDAHVHVVHVLDFAHVTGDEVLPLYLAAGVTSIRSTGDEVVAATLVARFAEAQPESSPRVFTCSPLLDADPPIHRDVGRGVTDRAQVPSLLEELGKWRVRTIKIYAGTGRPIGQAIIHEAHRRGMFVTATWETISPRMRLRTASTDSNTSGRCSTTFSRRTRKRNRAIAVASIWATRAAKRSSPNSRRERRLWLRPFLCFVT